MTLNEWVEKGNPMLSVYVTGWVRQLTGKSENILRAMKMEDIFNIPQVGEVAKREVDSWKKQALAELESK